MPTTTQAPAPVVKTIDVGRDPDHCFAVFTARLGDWWPLESHSISAEKHGQPARTAVVEPRAGGRVYEIAPDGTEHHWGEVLAFDRGRRFAMTWQLGRARDAATEVEVLFAPLPGGGTRVTLTHRLWERLGSAAAQMRTGYDQGWAMVFGERFAAAAA